MGELATGRLSRPAAPHQMFSRVREEKFPFFPSRIFSWSNDLIDIRQVNRREKNLISYIWEPQRCKGKWGSGGFRAILS